MEKGCYTAIVTPFAGDRVDYAGLDRLVDFQIGSGITGILAVGTTGESPTLSWDEHNRVVEAVANKAKGRCRCIAGTGSNNTREALTASRHAVAAGVDAVLLVDPYYNGPSSLEIRKEYVAPVAAALPETDIIPYVIPGRTGCKLLPEDLALLFRDHPNVRTVKEATADLSNMRRTRTCCGPDFTIMSGDDGMTFDMMTDPEIRAAGVISVASNVAPAAMVDLIRRLEAGDIDGARNVMAAVEPLFDLVTVKSREKTPFGEVEFRARNPLAIKTLMAILGMVSGGCRPPLGKMTRTSIETVLGAARKIHANHPEILAPVAAHFGVDISARLEDPANWKDLVYDAY